MSRHTGPVEQASLTTKPEQRQREAYLALARLDWDYAPRFLEIARKYPGVPRRDRCPGLARGQRVHAARVASGRRHPHPRPPGERRDDPDLSPIGDQAQPRPRRPPNGSSAPPRRRPRRPMRARPGLPEAGGPPQDLADAIRKMRGPEPEPFFKSMELARSGGRGPTRREDEDPDALTREAMQFYDRVVEHYADFRQARQPGRTGRSVAVPPPRPGRREARTGGGRAGRGRQAPEAERPSRQGRRADILGPSAGLPRCVPALSGPDRADEGPAVRDPERQPRREQADAEGCDRLGRDHLAMLVGRGNGGPTAIGGTWASSRRSTSSTPTG